MAQKEYTTRHCESTIANYFMFKALWAHSLNDFKKNKFTANSTVKEFWKSLSILAKLQARV